MEQFQPRVKKQLSVFLAIILSFCLVCFSGCSSDVSAEKATDEKNEQVVSGENVSTEELAETENSADSSVQSSSSESNRLGNENTKSASSEKQSGSKESSSTPVQPVQQATIRVSVYVDSSKASSLGYPNCMANKSMNIKEGSSVYDALVATGLSIGGSSSYVKSINGLAEKALGGTSGWMYSVNGETPMKAAGKYILKNGDSVRWRFVESW